MVSDSDSPMPIISRNFGPTQSSGKRRPRSSGRAQLTEAPTQFVKQNDDRTRDMAEWFDEIVRAFAF